MTQELSDTIPEKVKLVAIVTRRGDRSLSYHHRLKQLDQFLVQNIRFWKPHPFKIERPGWCLEQPELTHALLGLDDSSLASYAADSSALISFISDYIPQMAVIPSMVELPATTHQHDCEIESHLNTGIPGRKWEQIRALYQSLENPHCGIIEWCGGKGYLGRLLSEKWEQPVITLEYNQLLVDAGRSLADKFNVNQQFKHVDVINGATDIYLRRNHAIALHACGDLHRQLIHQIINTKAASFSIVPCCYHLGRNIRYTPFTDGLKLNISRETLRLAVSETVTAHHNEINQRNQDMAWKLAFQQLRTELTGCPDYQSFKPVPKAWLKEGFQGYCQKLCEREKLILPDVLEWSQWECKGEARHHDVMRLQLLRQCFKRVLELWLIMDMAVYLQGQAYHVKVDEFCQRSLTPRNILIQGSH